VKDLSADTSGATALEYALIASVVSIVIFTGANAIGTKLEAFFTSITFTP
jgi:pilus assembly protein Flp/PilA